MSEEKLAPLDPELAALLEQERRRPAPSAQDQARLAARVDSTVLWLAPGGAAATGAAVGTAAATGAGKSALKWLAKQVAGHWKLGMVTAFAAGGLAGAGAQHLVESKRAAPAPAMRVEAAAPPAVPVVPAAAVDAPSAPEPSAPEPVRAAVPPKPKPTFRVVKENPPAAKEAAAAVEESRPAPAREEKPVLARDGALAQEGVLVEAALLVRDVALAQERVLIEAARTSLARGRRAEALESLQEHERQFPQGILAEERESLRVRQLLAEGNVDAARERARLFHDKFPRSMLWPSLKAALDESDEAQ